MVEGAWGLLGPEFLSNARRTRTLGLGASARRFNDLAVPGLGGVWYGKQLLLATLGVAVAEKARSEGAKIRNIEMANAIEALACWQAFKSNDWRSDARLRGNTKLQGKDDFSFRRVRQRTFYVTQPMRMATAQALPALGFVRSGSTRFNAFCCSSEGMDFIEKAAGGCRPSNRTVVDHLTWWAQKENYRVDADSLRQVISPLNRLPKEAIALLRERLIQRGNEPREDTKRRGNALAWVETLRKGRPDRLTWAPQPHELSEEHWHDLHAGALFFQAREAAIATLDAVEAYIGNQGGRQFLSLDKQIPEALNPALEKLKSAAQKYLNFKCVYEEADNFCRECVKDGPTSIVRTLVNRDGHVLRLVGDKIKPGPAFRGSLSQISADDEDQEAPQAASIPLPEGISYRVQNLYLLNLDMHGELDEWLTSGEVGGEA
ncbi:MAG: hypothetical protein AB7V18_20460 [Pyrinomonadaceae bacterium]